VPVTLKKPKEKVTEQIAAPRRMPWALQSVLWLVAAVAILEVSFAMAGLGEQEYLKPDQSFGYDLIPSKFVTWRKEGFARLHINSHGMQDVERALVKPAGTKRIAVLGDSFVEAMQVDRSRNFCNIVERQLNAADGTQKWEVLNFGVSNASLSQMYLRLKEKVSKFSPDVVAIEYPVDATYQFIPDQSATFLAARPIFHFDGHSLHEDRQLMYIWRQSPEGQRYRMTSWLRANSWIWGVVSNCVEQACGWWQGLISGRTRWGSELATNAPPAPATTVNANAVHLTPEALAQTEKRASQYYWPIADGLFKMIKDECDRQKCKLVVIRFSRATKNDNPEESRLLRETAARYGFPVIDAIPAFTRSRAEGARLFYDQHFNLEGHALLATEILNHIRSTIGMPSNVNP
jgi:hypothetical protein